jgi:acetolactate synthase-1/2/3 large subunit
VSDPRTGGRILVDQLALHGAERVFCVPGESYLAVLDALHDRPEIELVVGRMEASTANMACAHGQLTGTPGIMFATRGPGATQAAVAVHTAQQGSVPLILFVGLIPRAHRDREAWQEIDVTGVFGPLAKWAATIDDPARIPEYVGRAYRVALAGRPGPIVLGLPEDVLSEGADVCDGAPHQIVRPAPPRAAMIRVRDMVARAERPLVLVGGGGWSQRAAADTAALCESWGLPVAVAFRCQDYIDNRSPSFAGTLGLAVDPELAGGVRECDLLLALGARLDEPTTGSYELIASPRPRQALIHVHADPEELGRVFEPALAINAGAPEFAAAAAEIEGPDPSRHADWTAALHSAATAFQEPPPTGLGLDLARALRELRALLPEETIVTGGAGNYTLWLHRFWPLYRYGTQISPISGAMGYGLPAAIAAKLAHRDRPVLSFAGDGCLLMAVQELATAMRHEVPIVQIVVDNSSYGTIRMHQERRHPGRPSGTSLVNPDFVALARSFGAAACSVADTAGLVQAVRDAVDGDRPALVHVPLDPALLTPAAAAAAAQA